jgi:hypothetical protein
MRCSYWINAIDMLAIVRKMSSVTWVQDKEGMVWETLHHREQHHWLGEVGANSQYGTKFVGVSNPIIFQRPLHDLNGISRKKFKTDSDLIIFFHFYFFF